MLVSAVVCPHPPLLLPGLTGSADVAADLRTACLAAVEEMVGARPDRVVVIGGDGKTAAWDPRTPVDPSPYGGTAARLGAPVPRLPLSLQVGRTLVDASSWSGEVALQAIAMDASPVECAALGADLVSGGRTGLLVMGDGSARRGLKAPGYVDDRAQEFDARVVEALAAGDAATLAALEPGTAAELLVAGRAAWQVLAGALGAGRATGRVLHADDPFGVLYLVASWTPTGTSSPAATSSPPG